MNLQQIAQLEQQLNQVKTQYEQYFLGLEKREPSDLRLKVRRAIVEAAEDFQNNTAVKFRAQTLKSKLITYENYWNRILKQIEDGTYTRHRFKVDLHDRLASESKGTSGAVAAPLPAKSGGGAFDSVIAQYRDIQKQGGQQPIDPAKLMATLQKQEAQLKEKFGAQKIEFRVAIEDGKPKLKAKPIK